MNDLISRAALLAAYDAAHKGPPGGARKLIVEAPTVDAVQRTYTFNLQGDQSSSFECFACRWKCRDIPDGIPYRYCPMCCAKVLRMASEDEIFKGAKRVETPPIAKMDE
jgi:hypothetical protein